MQAVLPKNVGNCAGQYSCVACSEQHEGCLFRILSLLSTLHSSILWYLPLAMSCLVFQLAPCAPPDFAWLPSAKGCVETKSISWPSSKFPSVCGGTMRRLPRKPIRPPLTLLPWSESDIAFICLHRGDWNHSSVTKSYMRRAYMWLKCVIKQKWALLLVVQG